MSDAVRQAEETRVIDAARAFAVRRVESTVRHLRRVAAEAPVEYLRPNGTKHLGTADIDETQRLTTSMAAGPAIQPRPAATPDKPSPEDGGEAAAADTDAAAAEPVCLVPQSAPAAESEVVEPSGSQRTHPPEPDVSEVLEEPATDRHAGFPVDDATEPALGRHAELPADDTAALRPAEASIDTESDVDTERERLQQVLEFVARQAPGLRWAVGNREDGTTLLVTDLAHGWIPPGITLPAGVRLLEPQRRTGNAARLLGNVTASATYAPGDPLGWASDVIATESSAQPRELPAVHDLGWLLGEATHWRDGLPRMVHTLAKAGGAGTGVVEAEIDLLRVHLDTARYQLLAQYPDVDAGLLLNCMLLAATEGMATSDRLSANYHFAWFQTLSAPPASRWATNP